MMKKRRTSKRQKPTQEIVIFLILCLAFSVWYKTDSLQTAAISVGVAIGISIAMAIVLSIRREIRLLQSGIADIDKMSGVQFEEYLKTLFTNRGYSVTLTPGSGDYGADLVLKKDQDVIVVQAKRYRQSVGVKAVQEVIPAMRLYKANEAWVITNSMFTRQALHLAKYNHVRMIDRWALVRLITETKRQRKRGKS